MKHGAPKPSPPRIIDARKLLDACDAEGVDVRSAIHLAAGDDVRGRAAIRAFRALEAAATTIDVDPKAA